MRNTGLEAIRAMAAMMVLFSHAVLIIPGVHQSVGLGRMMVNWGVESVVIFFLLSGIVIRISYDKTPRSAGRFLWTRAARLLPLYLCAVFFSVLVLVINKNSPSLSVVIGNCLFLQSLPGFIVPVIQSDSALWSLAFEAFFYVTFALCLFGRKEILMPIWCAAATIALISQFILSATGWLGHLQQVLAYSSIWLLGYYCVDLAARFYPGMLCSFAFLGLLPMASRLTFSEEYFLAGRHFLVACTAVPLFVFVLRDQAGKQDPERLFHWVLLAAGYLSLGLASQFFSKSIWYSKIVFLLIPFVTVLFAYLMMMFSRIFKSFEPAALFLGQLSYAIYLFHMPVYALANVLGFSGISGALILMSASIIFAILAEFYVHPFLSQLMFPRRKHSPASRQNQENEPASPLPDLIIFPIPVDKPKE